MPAATPFPTSTPIGHIFSQLAGTWKLRRTLTSALPGFPSGTFTGSATFASRKPTSPVAAGELLYSEQGELRTDNGLTLRARRRYVYRYDADEDKISAWFVKEKEEAGGSAGKGGESRGGEVDDAEVDYLFHDLEMKHEDVAWTARGEHLCSLDMYWAYYEFRLPPLTELGEGKSGTRLDVFGLRYKVQGPQKDYTSDTAYERQSDSTE